MNIKKFCIKNIQLSGKEHGFGFGTTSYEQPEVHTKNSLLKILPPPLSSSFPFSSLHNHGCFSSIRHSMHSLTSPIQRRVPLVSSPLHRLTSSCLRVAPPSAHRRRALAELTAGGLIAAGVVAMAGAAYTTGSNPFKDPRALTHAGMDKFMKGDVEGSISDFDEVIRLDKNRAPYMWQRGLSLYYVGRFKESAEQFRLDVAVNPNDTEEAIWAFLAEAKDPGIGIEAARKNFLKVGVDPRPVMRTAYEVFKTGGDPDLILKAATNAGHDKFYSLLYHSLYFEAEGAEAQAKKSMLAAVKTEYGLHSGDYMTKLAAVHAKRRGWM